MSGSECKPGRPQPCNSVHRQGQQELPALVKAGWLRPSSKRREATLAGRRRGGWFELRIDSSGSLNEPPRPRLSADAFGDILLTARPPRLNQGGVFAHSPNVLKLQVDKLKSKPERNCIHSWEGDL